MSFTLPERLTEAAERASTALGELLDLVHQSNPADVAATLAAVEKVGRLADAARVRAAVPLMETPELAQQLGFTSERDAVASLAQISLRSAGTRIRLADAIHTTCSITGQPLAPERPAVAAALDAGELGLETADLIVRELAATNRRAEKFTQDAAEQLMVTIGSGLDPVTGAIVPPVSADYIAAELRQIALVIDPDGARPREERALRNRGIRFGKPTDDGRVPLNGSLLSDVAELFTGLLEAHRRSPRFVDESALDDEALSADNATDSSPGDLAPDVLFGAASADNRTPDQRRHDAFADLLATLVGLDSTPKLNGSPVTVVVTVNADDLELDADADDADSAARDGDPIGTMAGSDVPVSRAEVLRFIDAAGYRVVTLKNGRIVDISSQQRCFTHSQRLAIAARDGYRCFAPGCTASPHALQAHHVLAFRDGGPTHTDDGILLCYWHHRIVDTGPWQYRMVDGVPEVRGPGIPQWTRRTPLRPHPVAA
ncbi:hypothetical protein M2152_002040 [Microbacteriaceae bacterium SG_E_30_P1]|uniref:HNH nuclease domain-containing protein n=1 Tax=Antiquaquibacter oligotrophicus TaxID=2880260 RepID=A0ABT6KPD7_9MICO|nr:HNH endonuclease signature motif containing protein [Antiquaquibacter oligotrophicus]MDH6181858.1 hypothetical protein [Antiquaquibacter oligotrophicus]UDF12465.1 HNH endonuclease [Antiquaquibacter oligotrophicus]